MRAGIPAMGLWVMAGSWCADNLTDGWLPDYIAMRLDRDYEANAKTLVQVGLWAEETRDGEPGWAFHEWNEPGRQPTKEQVLTDRAAAADRQKRARDRAKERRGRESRDDSHDRHAVTTTVTDGVSHGGVTPAVTVPPTRPDPTRPVNPKTNAPLGAERATAVAQPAFAGMPAEEPKSPRQQRRRTAVTEPDDEDRERNAKDVVAAFVDAVRERGRTATQSVIGQVGKTAKQILEEKSATPEQLIVAAREMGLSGQRDLNSQLLRGGGQGYNGGGYAGRPSTRHRMTDSRSPDLDYSENF